MSMCILCNKKDNVQSDAVFYYFIIYLFKLTNFEQFSLVSNFQADLKNL